MPVIEIDAFDWVFEGDLDSGALFASAYRLRYDKVDVNHAWDNTHFTDDIIYKGGAPTYTIRISVTLEGVYEVLTTGVIDRTGIGEEEGSRFGTLEGRDLLALLLDSHPSQATFPAGTDVFSIIRSLAAQAGLIVVTSGLVNFSIASDYVVDKTKSIASHIDDLLAPNKWARKKGAVTWIEGNILTIVPFEDASRNTVTIPYDRVQLDSMYLYALPSYDGIRVEGANYEVLTEDLKDPRIEISEGWTDTGNVPGEQGDTSVYRTITHEVITSYYDAYERLYRQDTVTDTWNYRDFILQRQTQETHHKFGSFFDSPSISVNIRGKRSSELETWQKTREDGLLVLYKKITRSWTYDDDGNPASELSSEYEFDVETGEVVQTKRDDIRYYAAPDQITRVRVISEVDAGTGEVTRTSEHSEVGMTSKNDERKIAPTPAGFKRETANYKCGSDTAERVESSSLIGTNEDCCALLSNLQADSGATELSASLTVFLPMPGVRQGTRVTISGAPSVWPTNQFLVVSVRTSSRDNVKSQRLECLAWPA